MMQGSTVLALWIDIDPVVRDECDAWYINRHIADRIALPGWRRARRFFAISPTKPATLALYEVAQDEDLISDAYLGLQSNVNAIDIRMRAAFSNVVRDTFRVRHSTGAGEGGLMLSLRFRPDAAATTDETAMRRLTGQLPALAALDGVVAVHLLRQAPELRARHDEHRKSGNDDAMAYWVLLVEATELDRITAVRDYLSTLHVDDALGLDVGQLGIYDLAYSVQSPR